MNPNVELRIDGHDDARKARAQVVDFLCEHAAPASDLLATELIISELVGNALRHGSGCTTLEFEWNEEDFAVLHVCSRGEAFELPATLPVEPAAESGRGLFLVQAIALDLRIERRHGINRVRVVLPARRRTSAAAL